MTATLSPANQAGGDGGEVSLDVGDGDSAAREIEKALQDARAKLKEQAARHWLEQESVLERLIASVGATQSRSETDTEALSEDTLSFSKCRSLDPKTLRKSITSSTLAESLSDLSSHRSRCTSVLVDESSYKSMNGMDSKPSQAGGIGGVGSPFMAGYPLDSLDHVLETLVQHSDSNRRVQRSIQWLLTNLRKLGSTYEPVRDGPVAKVVESRLFWVVCTICICLNSVFLVFAMDYEMARQVEHPWMFTLECAFMTVYVVEIAMRLFVHRLFFFWCEDAGWNIFEFMCVALSVIDVGLTAMRTKPSASNLSFLRLFDVVRRARVLRIVRSVRYFGELRLIFSCLVGSFASLIWCSLMLTLVVFLFSLFIIQSLASDAELGIHISDAHDRQLHKLFGSVRIAMMTLIRSATGGDDWGDALDILIEGNHIFAVASFLAYILFFSVSVWNVVTSLFVEKALKFAKADSDKLEMESKSKDAKDARELTAMLSALDTDGSGTISLDEMRTVIQHPRLQRYLHERGIAIGDVEMFHNMLVSIGGRKEADIDIHFVVAACLRMKGVASSLDMHAFSFESRLLGQQLLNNTAANAERLGRIERAVEEALGSMHILVEEQKSI